MPIDDRSDLDRLTRHQLYMEAAAWGIEHPPDLPKYIWRNGSVSGGMISLLESRGVNRANMKTVKWQTVAPTDEERAAAAHQGTAVGDQHYPVQELNQSARDGVDSSAILQERISKAEARVELKTDENKRLREVNAALEARLAALEAKASKPKRKNPRGELFKKAKALGLKTSLNMTIEDLEKLVGENSP